MFEMGHLETVLNMAKKGQVPGAPMQFNLYSVSPGVRLQQFLIFAGL